MAGCCLAPFVLPRQACFQSSICLFWQKKGPCLFPCCFCFSESHNPDGQGVSIEQRSIRRGSVSRSREDRVLASPCGQAPAGPETGPVLPHYKGQVPGESPSMSESDSSNRCDSGRVTSLSLPPAGGSPFSARVREMPASPAAGSDLHDSYSSPRAPGKVSRLDQPGSWTFGAY